MIKARWKQFKSPSSIYQGIIIIITIYFLINNFLLIINGDNIIYKDLQLNQKASLYLGFFHIHINILIATYFFVNLIYYQKQNQFTSNTTLLSLMSYSILTMVIFFTGLIPPLIQNPHWILTPYQYVIIIFQHFIIPLSSIIYCYLFVNFEVKKIKKFLQKKFFISLIYPILYFVYILIKSKLNWEDHLNHNELYIDLVTNKINVTQIFTYPFFALQLEKTYLNISGWWTITITAILFIAITILSFYIFLLLMKLKNQTIKKRRVNDERQTNYS